MSSNSYLRCTVTAGQFHSELAVAGTDYSGEEYSLFVDRRFVEAGEVPANESVKGMLLVTEIASEGDLVLVRLPGQTLANGRTITVRRAELDPAYQTT